MQFLELTFREAERMKSLGRIGVSKNYANSARQLQKYLATIKKKDVSFRKLSAGLLKDFEDWLHQNGVCRNTRPERSDNIAAIVHIMITGK